MNETLDPGLPPAAPASNERRELPFVFRGSGGEYFRIWIVNLLLTIVTLGIFSAWAKVRRLRYFYGNTYLDEHSFEYHGNPIAILKGRLIVFFAYVLFIVAVQFVPWLVFLMIPLFIFGVPWIIMRSRMFQMRMTSWRNIRFNFHGTYGGAMAAFVGWYLLASITIGILFPLWVKKRVAYSLENSAYGNERFRFVTSTGTFYKFCLITAVLAIAAYAGFIAMLFHSTRFGDVMYAQQTGEALQIFSIIGITGFLFLLGWSVIALGIAGYYQASFMNASFGGIEVGEAVAILRLDPVRLMGIYITNLLGIVFTLGLYYPWAKVRQARYHLENSAVNTSGSLANVSGGATPATDAVGEEVGDFFDVDFGL